MRLGDETAEIIRGLRQNFPGMAYPSGYSDNAPYYASNDPKRFAEDWQFKHTTSLPTHSQNNGKAELAVKIIKHIFKTASDLWKALLEWRASPKGDFCSPSE